MPPPSWIWSAIDPSAAPIFSSARATISVPFSHVLTRSPTARTRSVFQSPMRSSQSFPGLGCTSQPRPYDS